MKSRLCGRAPGRLCFGVLASNADAFHSSGCKRGASLRNVTLSNNFDDFLNVHSRMQMLGDKISGTELIVLDPRLAVAAGSPNDTPCELPAVSRTACVFQSAARSSSSTPIGRILSLHDFTCTGPFEERISKL